MTDKRIIKVDLINPESRAEFDVEKHKDDWIEFDTTNWSMWHYRVIPNTNLHDCLEMFVEVYASDWSITGSNGKKVKFPGQAAPAEDWLEVYSQMPAGLSQFISTAPVRAVYQASRPPKKSDGEGNGGSP